VNTVIALFHLYKVLKIVKFIESKWNGGCQRLRGGRNGKLQLNKVSKL
jgi:hypothetical protein